jgi:hypothetical protein
LPLTFRELAWAAQGKAYHDWEIASHLLSLIANCHRDPKKRPILPTDIFRRPGSKIAAAGKKLTVDTLHALKPAFTKGR